MRKTSARRLDTWIALPSYGRATTETDAPGASAAATISRFNPSGHPCRPGAHFWGYNQLCGRIHTLRCFTSAHTFSSVGQARKAVFGGGIRRNSADRTICRLVERCRAGESRVRIG